MPCFVYKLCIQLKGGKFKVKVWADICLQPRQQSLVNKFSREMRKGKKKQGNWGRQKMVKRGLGRRSTVGSYWKTRQKRDSILIVLVPGTVWQILNVKCRQPETEVMWICRNFHGKTREIATSELIFVADFSNLEPKCDPRPVPVNINYVLSTQVVQLETKGIAISQTIIWVRFSPAGVVSSFPPSTSPPSNSLF